MDRLFVYGSLQPGGPNHHRLAGFEGSWARATLKGHLKKAGWGAELGYPGLVLAADGEEVRGQVFTSAALAELWAELDRFEGDEYERVETEVTVEPDSVMRAYVYVLSAKRSAG